MNYTNSYTINGSLFQEFLGLLGRMTQDQLIRQIEFMKVENEILRSKLPRRITTSPAEKRRLIKYGLPLRGQIKQVISIVGYSTFRRITTGRDDKALLLGIISYSVLSAKCAWISASLTRFRPVNSSAVGLRPKMPVNTCPTALTIFLLRTKRSYSD